MQHSYEGLDREGGFDRAKLLQPLRYRDFRLLWTGMTISLLGDGLFFVAMAWQVYTISNAPTALSLVGIAMAVPQIAFLLLGGVVSDRMDRRIVMLAADALRGCAVLAMGLLTVAGVLELWHMILLVALYGAGSAFFGPAFDAIVPDVLPRAELARANSLDHFVRPLALRMIGPAIGGWLVAGVGAGPAFMLDAGSFAVGIVMLLLMRTRFEVVEQDGAGDVVSEIREGFRYIRSQTWLWATFVAAAFAYLLFMGPTEVLLPYLVKNELHAGADWLGLIFAAGGIGSLLVAIAMGQHDLPRRPVAFMYVTWTIATVAVVGYGLSTQAWQLMAACFAFNALETAGTIVWATLKQREVPARLLGRVSSLDWLISIGLLPLSFALTGPMVAVSGARITLVVAGIAGGIVTLAPIVLVSVRALDHRREADVINLDERRDQRRQAA